MALLVALNAAGEWLVHAARVPVPGSVAGMVMLTLLVHFGVVPLRLVLSAGDLLVRHLALLYVPAGVALIAYAGVVRHDLVPITVAALASLVAALLVAGVIVQRLERGT